RLALEGAAGGMRPTRSMEATDSAGTAYVAQRRRALPNGWWGMAVFLATEAALFGSMIGSYFYLRFTSPQWPQGGIEAPSVALPRQRCGEGVAAAPATRRGRRAAGRGAAAQPGPAADPRCGPGRAAGAAGEDGGRGGGRGRAAGAGGAGAGGGTRGARDGGA